MRNTLRIGMGNGHNRPGLVQWYHDSKADSFSAHESQRLGIEFPGATRRVIVAGEGWVSPDGKAQETCVITLNKWENIGEMTRLVSEAVPGKERVAPDRVLAISMFEHPVATEAGFDGIAHAGLHPNAGPRVLRGSRPRSPILREYRESMESTRDILLTLENDGLLPILSGDLQLRWRDRQPWSPYQMFVAQLGWEAHTDAIDWVLWHPSLELLGVQKRQLLDHVGICVELGARAGDER
jgi:hypothetical protein